MNHRISKGFDIRLVGRAEAKVDPAPEPLLVAVSAREFPGIKPKLLVKEGDSVRTGDPLFFDKKDRDTMYLSPATGKVTKVLLGARRALQRIEITLGTGDEFAELAHVAREKLASTDREELIKAIKQAGLWPLLRQRPIGRTAKSEKAPSAIYVNGMDTEPLAADPAFCVEGKRADLE
ncbi:MAG: hypothetical protein KDB80_05165, partial [Planctomycetes bacterium]|nr:hypothetical protein [Planctomycetota bacterium]